MTPTTTAATVECRCQVRVRRELVGVDVDGPLLRRQGVQRLPHLHDAGPPRWEHAVLQRV